MTTESPKEAWADLRKLRETVKAVAPKAVEVISYQILQVPRAARGYAAFKNHCGFYLMSLSVIDAHKNELKRYHTAKATGR